MSALNDIEYWLQDCQKLIQAAREKRVHWQILKAKGHHRASSYKMEYDEAMDQLEDRIKHPPITPSTS